MVTVNKLKGNKASTAAPTKPAPAKPAPTAPTKPTPAPSTPRPVPTPSNREKVTLTAKDVGTAPANLIQSNTSVATVEKESKGLAIPAFLTQATHGELAPQMVGDYVGFASTMSKNWIDMQAAGCVDGQAFIFYRGQYIVPKQLEFFLCMSSSFQTQMEKNKDAKFLFATRDMKATFSYQDGVQPHYVALLLVDPGNGSLIPIKGDFRGTKSGGIENAVRAVEAASRPEWLRLSDAHKTTAMFNDPFGRVYHRITLKPCISKQSGNAYNRATCASSPATPDEIMKLVRAFKDTEFLTALDDAHKSFLARVEFLDGIVANGPQQ
jgi:hypothetical protein